MAVDDQMTGFAMSRAKNHVHTVIMMGHTFTLIRPGAKDRMGGRLADIVQELHAHPVRHSPFSRKVTEHIGWAEDMNILFYGSKQEIDALGLTLNDLKRFTKVKFLNKEYGIAHIIPFNSFANDFLHYIIGVKL